MQTRRSAPKQVSYHPRDVDVPMLPGNNFHDDPICRATLRKSHALGLETTVHPNAPLPATSYSHKLTFDHKHTATQPGFHVTLNPSSYMKNRNMPATGDPVMVLRFLAYFKENIVESPHQETIRVRKVSIVYHIDDETMLIREAQQVNSGMQQGVLARRQVVYKPITKEEIQTITNKTGVFYEEDNRIPYRPSDFYLGAEIVCHGITYVIVDMDERTRKYYGNAPESALPWPTEDMYNLKMVPQQIATRPKKQITVRDMDLRRHMEFSVVGVLSKHHPDDVRAAQQFLGTDSHRHTLQFAAIWNDSDKLHGDVRTFVLKYYLENDTIELCEARSENNGRDTTTNKFVSRMRILKPDAQDAIEEVDQQHDTFGFKLKSHYMTYHDLYVGGTVKIHGRSYFLYEADEATRAWYRTNGNRELDPAIDIRKMIPIKRLQDAPPVKHIAPPYNGYGSEEDSLQNWKYIVLRAPRRDLEKLKLENKVLRFRAEMYYGEEVDESGEVRLVEPTIENSMRSFVVNYYMATDEVEIIEMPVRNSGYISGKFLAKGRHEGNWTLDQFYEGAILQVRGHTFRLVELSEVSKKMLEGMHPPTNLERLRYLLTLLRTLTQQKYYCPREAFRAAAPTGTITAEGLQAYYKHCNTDITLEEAASVISFHLAACNKRDPSIVEWDFQCFRHAVEIPNSFSMDESANVALGHDEVAIVKQQDVQKASLRHKNIQSQAKIKEMRNDLRSKLLLRRGTCIETFRLLTGANTRSVLTRETFRNALVDVLHYNVKQEEMDMICDILFPPWREDQPVTLAEFSAFMDGNENYFKKERVSTY